MQEWDHTQPFPETRKTGCSDSDKVLETIWKMGHERYAESLRNAQIRVMQCRAAGHNIKIPTDPDLYAQFPELAAMESAAESSFATIQKAGEILPPLM